MQNWSLYLRHANFLKPISNYLYGCYAKSESLLTSCKFKLIKCKFEFLLTSCKVSKAQQILIVVKSMTLYKY